MQQSTHPRRHARLAILGALVGMGSMLAGACAPPAPAPSSSYVTVRDPWSLSAGAGSMSAALGVLVSSADREITVVAATSDVSPDVSLHETVPDGHGGTVMQPKVGGFKIPAGGEHVLEPGADHLMLMDLNQAVHAGDNVLVTLTFEDGSTLQFNAPAQDFTWPM